MTMHEALPPRDDVDRLYIPRKEQGRGFGSIEDSVRTSIKRLKDYIEKHERGLITAIRNNTDNMIDKSMTKTRKQKREGKQLYVRFKWLINNISYDKTWTWQRKGNFKRVKESLQMITRNSSIRTNHINIMRWQRRNNQSHNTRMQQIGTEEVQGYTRLGGQGDLLGNVQVMYIRPCQQIVYAQPSTRPSKWHSQTPVGLWYTNGSPKLGQKTRPYNNQPKNEIRKIVDFAAPADHRIKL